MHLLSDQDIADIRNCLTNKNKSGLIELLAEAASDSGDFDHDDVMLQLRVLFRLDLGEAIAPFLNSIVPSSSRAVWRQIYSARNGTLNFKASFLDINTGELDSHEHPICTIAVNKTSATLEGLDQETADYIERMRDWRGDLGYDVWEVVCTPSWEIFESDSFGEEE